MVVQVKWFPTLVKRTKSKQDRTEVAWRDGLTPLGVFKDEGFNDADAEVVMVVINDTQMEMGTLLGDGDRLEYVVNIQGGGIHDSRFAISD